MSEIWQAPQMISHVQNLLNSFERWVKRPMLNRNGSPEDQAKQFYEAPFVVVSHGTQTDPIFNFGNRRAQELWELDFQQLTSLPSRYTAEPVHRDERARLLERTTRDGYVDDYSGIRISSTGKRFRIHQAIVWNVVDDAGNFIGQAATFDQWSMLPNNSENV